MRVLEQYLVKTKRRSSGTRDILLEGSPKEWNYCRHHRELFLHDLFCHDLCSGTERGSDADEAAADGAMFYLDGRAREDAIKATVSYPGFLFGYDRANFRYGHPSRVKALFPNVLPALYGGYGFLLELDYASGVVGVKSFYDRKSYQEGLRDFVSAYGSPFMKKESD